MPSTSTDLPVFPYDELKKSLDAAQGDAALFDAIVNVPFQYKVESVLLFLGIIVLLFVNKKDGTIDRIALTRNERADGAKKMSVKRFEDIRIPIDHDGNIIAQAISTGLPQGTADWQYLFNPVLAPEEARFNQAGASIGYSAVYPLTGVSPDGGDGALIFSYFEYPEGIGQAQRDFMRNYSQLVSDRLKR